MVVGMDYPDPIDAPEAFRDHLLRLWAETTEDQQMASLTESAAIMDRIYNFKGRKKDPRQTLSWPRSGVRDGAGRPITGVPEAVKTTQAMFAMCCSVGISPLSDPRILAAGELMMRRLLVPGAPYLEQSPLQ